MRSFTPLECDRLMGLPDHWTAVPYRGKSAKDTPRYKALGNSMAVPVLRWIGERIAAVDAVEHAPALRAAPFEGGRMKGEPTRERTERWVKNKRLHGR